MRKSQVRYLTPVLSLSITCELYELRQTLLSLSFLDLYMRTHTKEIALDFIVSNNLPCIRHLKFILEMPAPFPFFAA